MSIAPLVVGERWVYWLKQEQSDGSRLAWDDIIFSPDIGKPEYINSKFLYIQKGATGLPSGWNY